ncbi:hypothetical protein HKX48_008572 [Thoreauomyces humboldtii]|nr:hypothetical protein HKX48_008572 [Thoreauomyces humboldtii]
MAATSFAFAITLAEDGTTLAPLDALPAPALSPVPVRKLTPIAGARDSLSGEDIRKQLDDAAERKLHYITQKAARAGAVVSDAKQRASVVEKNAADAHDAQLRSISDKLDAAATLRNEVEQTRMRKVAEHLELVEERRRRSGPPSPSLSRTQQKLDAAEGRRREQEQELLDRLHAHDAHARDVREKRASMGGMAM